METFVASKQPLSRRGEFPFPAVSSLVTWSREKRGGSRNGGVLRVIRIQIPGLLTLPRSPPSANKMAQYHLPSSRRLLGRTGVTVSHDCHLGRI